MKKFLLSVAVVLFFAGMALCTMNLNTVTINDLAVALGISHYQAALIIQHRERIGQFRSFNDLYDIEDLDPAIIEQIRTDAGIYIQPASVQPLTPDTL